MEHVKPPVVVEGSAIAAAIANVMKEAKSVEKRGENKFHGYKYATAADILHVIQPLMAREGLVVMQNEVSSQFLMGDTVLAVTFDFTLAHRNGEVWPEKIRRTGMCSAKNQKGGFDDKAFNKAVTTAHKYFLLTLFEIPTGDYAEADEDDDVPPPPPPRRQENTRADVPHQADKIEVAQAMVDAIKKRMSVGKLDGLVKHPDFKRDYDSLEAEDKAWVDSVITAQRAAIEDPTADTNELTPPEEHQARQAPRPDPEPAPAHTPGKLSQAAIRTVQQNQRAPSKAGSLIDDDIPF